MATLARPRRPRSAAPAPLPFDVRLMNRAAVAIFVLAALVLLAAGVGWLMRLPAFTLRSIDVQGDTQRTNAATLRANAVSRLSGGFFELDVDAARDAFQSVPWVRRATVRRVWPNQLAVTLEEHRPAALWDADTGSELLVNSHGEVFDANLGDVEDDALPRLSGPAGTSLAMLTMHARLTQALAPLDLGIDELALSGRGSWRAKLDNGATLELGRGDAEVIARAERFVRTYAQVASHYGERPLLTADLRHADGYALRLQGVSTSASAPTAAKK